MPRFPNGFQKSWQYRKVEKLYGHRRAQAVLGTYLAIHDYADEHGTGPIPVRSAMRITDARNYRDKRPVLAAMVQANLLRLTPEGYRVPAFMTDMPPPRKVALEQQSAAAEQLPLALERPRAKPKSLRKRASSLARAGAVSAPLLEKAPPIDPAPTCTEVLQATAVERSDDAAQPIGGAPRAQAPCLFPLRAQAKKQASHGPAVDRQMAREQPRRTDLLPASQRRSCLTSVGSLFSSALENIVRAGDGEGSSTVDSGQAAPRGLVEEPDAARRVKAQGVKKQQKDVSCRQPSSDAANLLRTEMLAMPTLFPDAAEIKRESARIWPHSPITGKLAETIMQQQTTRDELLTALAKVEKDIAAGRYKGPPVLIHVLGDVRQAREAESNKLFSQKRVADGGASTIRRAEIHQAICDYMGPERWRSHPDNTPYLLACDGHSQDEVVSLYTEMRDSEDDADWETVCMALAKGRQPRRTGILPAVSNEQLARAVFERFGPREKAPAGEKTGMESVQSFLDKRDRAS